VFPEHQLFTIHLFALFVKELSGPWLDSPYPVEDGLKVPHEIDGFLKALGQVQP